MLIKANVAPTLRSHQTDKFSPSQAAEADTSFADSLQDRVELSSARAQEIEAGLGAHEPGQVLVKVSPDLTSEQMKELAADFGATIKQELKIPEAMQEAFQGKLMLMEAGFGLSEAETMALMEQDSRILLAATNDHMELFKGRENDARLKAENGDQPEPTEKLPNDVHPEQWNIRNRNFPGGVDGADIQAGKAWTITTGKGGPIVAVVDSGIDAFHEDLSANMWVNPNEEDNDKDDNMDGFTDDIHGLNAVDGTGNIFDEIGHGTHVAGIIGAVSDNGKGVAGINWDSQLMGVKITDGDRVSLLGAINGILYAAENGARIANHSWGGRVNNPILKDIMQKSPLLHVCAAGNAQNDADQVPSFPAAYDFPNVISVAASTRRESHVYFSNWGTKSVDLHAPGAIVVSTEPVHKYGEKSGTSMAAPHVSGVAALIASKYPEASNQEIKDRILYSADKVEAYRDKSFTGGRLNAFRALEDDKIAPAKVKDLKMEGLTSDGFELRWTGVGDDGLKGVLSQYDVWAEFGDQKERLVPTFPKEAGQNEKVSFRTIPQAGDRDLKVTLTPVDNVGNRAESSVIEETLPTSSVPMEDNFDQDKGWEKTGTWARVKEEGRGMVYTDSPEGNYNDSEETGIISPKFDLSQMRSATLRFDARMKTEKFDFIWIAARHKDSDRYEHIDVIRPEHGLDWNSFQFDMSEFDGKKDVQVRLSLRTSNDENNDGVYIDNVRIDSAKVPQ